MRRKGGQHAGRMHRIHLLLFLICMLASQPWGVSTNMRGTTLADSIAKVEIPKSIHSDTLSLPKIPMELPDPKPDGKIQISVSGVPRALTIHGRLQLHLEEYIKNRGNPVSAVVVVEVKTGNILAMAQGKNPKEWHSNTPTALHEYFPAASIFKVVSTLAAVEELGLDSQHPIELNHRCGVVLPSDVGEVPHGKKKRKKTASRSMSMEEALGRSCNAYFAKLGARQLGLPAITHYAELFGWVEGGVNAVKTDFTMPPSSFHPSETGTMDPFDLGVLAAGLGTVEMSPIHAASIMLLLANNGVPKKLKLFEEPPATIISEAIPPARFGADTSSKIRTMMHKTVDGGSASHVFHQRAYSYLRENVGAKTGTRQGRLYSFPKNTPANGLLTTWLTLVYPYDRPEVVVAAVVANNEVWRIRGSDLGAEAVREWDFERRGLVASVEKPFHKGKRKGKRKHR